MDTNRQLTECGFKLKKLQCTVDVGCGIPTRAHQSDAGLDLYCKDSFIIWPFSRKTVETGVHVMIPEGYVGLLTSKSGLMRKRGVTCRGTIDSGYIGSIQAVMFNHSMLPRRFKAGDKITQLVIFKIETPYADVVDELKPTDRGSDGFGSTGR